MHIRNVLVALSLSVLFSRPCFSQSELTRLGEFAVNSTTAGFQGVPKTAALPGGGFVAVWQGAGAGQTGAVANVIARIYDAGCSPISAELLVNTPNTQNAGDPAIASDAKGNFTIAWINRGPDGSDDVFARVFNSAGTPLTPAITVVQGPGTQDEPAVAMSAETEFEGQFIVGWTDTQGEGDRGIFARRYAAGGTPSGSIIHVNTVTANDQAQSAIAMRQDGGFLIVWTSTVALSPLNKDIRARLFDRVGAPVAVSGSTAEFAVRQAPGLQSTPSLSFLEASGFVVAFEDTNASALGDSDGTAVVAQRLDFAGQLIGSAFRVNDSTVGDQTLPTVRHLPSGDAIFCWASAAADTSGLGVAFRRFQVATGSAQPTPIDVSDVRANTFTQSDQYSRVNGSIAVDSSGNFAIVWQSEAQDGDGWGLFADKFYLPNQGPPLEEFRVNTTTEGNQMQPAVAINATGRAAVIWRTPSTTQGKFKLVGQLYDSLGRRSGGEFLVSTANSPKVEYPAVAMADDGAFVVAWTGADFVAPDGITVLSEGVFARRFAADGTPGPIKGVNDYQNDAQGAVCIAMNGTGTHVIAWHSRDATSGGDTSGYGIFAKRFDAAGNQVGTEFLVNKSTSGSQTRPAAAMAPNGSFVIVWTTSFTESDGDVFLRRFGANGTGDPNEVAVNSFTNGIQGAASLGGDSQGNFTVAWSSEEQDGSGYGIYGRRFLASGLPRVEPFPNNPINASTNGDQLAPNVSVAPDGSFVVAYTSIGEDGGGPTSEGVFARRFDANAAPVITGPPVQVNQFVVGKQSFLDNDTVPGNRKVAMDGSGGYMIVWTSAAQDGNGLGVYATRVLTSSPPAVVTGPANTITSTSARLTGSVDPNNAATTAGFQYGLTTTYGQLVQITPAIPAGDAVVGVDRVITDLLPNQMYHYRVIGQNSKGASVGEDATFTTAAAPPIVTTDGATNVNTTGATVIGTINPNGAAVTQASVEYGITTSYGTSVAVTPAPGSGRAPVSVSGVLGGLLPNQTYHFRVTATNSAGTARGLDGTFTTGARAPAVVTGGTTGVSASGATLLGTVTPNGSLTDAAFEYGLTTAYGSRAAVSVSAGSGTAPVNVSVVISGLTPNRTYHYRLTASNAGGRADGQDATFNTPAQLPTVVTTAESEVGVTSAVLHGTVNPNGSATTAYFVFRKVGSLVQQQTSTVELDGSAGDSSLEFTLTDLEPYTDYEYRTVASNGAGNVEGAFEPFKTLVEPLLTQPDTFYVQLGGGEILLDVLANDAGTGLRITHASGAGLSIASDSRSLTFTPSSDSDVSQTFTYRVSDSAGNESADTMVTVHYFSSLQGTYYNGKTSSSGTVFLVRMDVDFAGVATGRLEWEDEQYAFKVNLNELGHAQVQRPRPDETQATLVTDFQADLSNAVPAVICAFRDLKPTPQEALDLGLNYTAPADPSDVPAKELQVIFIDPGEEENAPAGLIHSRVRGATGITEIPGGIGFSLVRITKKGTARFTTKMPDFGAFSTKATLIPASAQLLQRYLIKKSYKKNGVNGSVDGFTFPGPSNIPGVQRTHGTVAWTRATLTRDGFTNLIAAFDGFGFKAGSNGVPFGFESGNCKIRLARGGLLEPIEFSGKIQNGKMIVESQDTAILNLGLSVKFKLTGGTFSGSFTMSTAIAPDLVQDEKVKIRGGVAGDLAFLPIGFDKQDPRVRGSFHVKSTGRTGRIEITPR